AADVDPSVLQHVQQHSSLGAFAEVESLSRLALLGKQQNHLRIRIETTLKKSGLIALVYDQLAARRFDDVDSFFKSSSGLNRLLERTKGFAGNQQGLPVIFVCASLPRLFDGAPCKFQSFSGSSLLQV